MAPASLAAILKNFGLSEESGDRVRLGRGVVGRTTYAVVAALVVLALVAWRGDPAMLFWIAVLTLVLFLAYFGGVLWFAHRHPGVALLEGAELLRWRQTELAAKGIASIPPVPALQEPESEEVLSATSESEEGE